jgi:phage/plasmid primase-like uncharacterized protein
MNMNDPKDLFRQAIAAAGFEAPDVIELGKMQRFSTNGRRSDTSGWCRLFLDGHAGVFGDFRSGFSSVWSAKDSKPPTLSQRQQRFAELQQARAAAATAQSIQWARAAAKNSLLWAQAIPITPGDPVSCYLNGRGIKLEVWPQALRYHSSLDYWLDGQSIGRFPAMVGVVTEVAGQMVSLHRTYLTVGGQKANVEIVKKLTASSAPLAGCSIKLVAPNKLDGALTIAVAEGIETALACFAASTTPTVSAISASGMERYQWPEGLQSLIVFADNDVNQVGQHAGAALARRAKLEGLKVRVLTPPDAGTDWADIWASQVEER